MIVAIGLIGVFLSGFLLGAVFGYTWLVNCDEPVATDWVWGDGTTGVPTTDVSGGYDVDVTGVLGDVPPTWTEDALR